MNDRDSELRRLFEGLSSTERAPTNGHDFRGRPR